MPYIQQNFRDEVDPIIEEFIKKVNEVVKNNPNQTRDGMLNYSITKMLNGIYPQTRYHALNEVVGMLECCKLEYYRKRIGPYEDIKEVENGPVDTYDENTGELKKKKSIKSSKSSKSKATKTTKNKKSDKY